ESSTTHSCDKTVSPMNLWKILGPNTSELFCYEELLWNTRCQRKCIDQTGQNGDVVGQRVGLFVNPSKMYKKFFRGFKTFRCSIRAFGKFWHTQVKFSKQWQKFLITSTEVNQHSSLIDF